MDTIHGGRRINDGTDTTDDPPRESANRHYRTQDAGKGEFEEWTPFTVQAVTESLDIEGR